MAFAISRNQLDALIAEFKAETNSFKEISPEVLCNRPKFVLLLRLNMGLSQPRFGIVTGLTNCEKYEKEKIKRMKLRTAATLLAKTSMDFDEGRVIQFYTQFGKESDGWFKANQETEKAGKARQKGAIVSMRLRRTLQESDLFHALEERGFVVECNLALSNKIIADFVLPDCVIECKRLVTTNRRHQTKKMRELAYEGYKIKFLYPKIKLFALVEAQLPLWPTDYEELQGPFDNVFTTVGDIVAFIGPSQKAKSVWPESLGPHVAYNGSDNGLRRRKAKAISETESKFRLRAETRPHEAGMASNRASSSRGEYVPVPCTHRPSSHPSLLLVRLP